MKKVVLGALVVGMGLLLMNGCAKLPDERLLEKGKKFEDAEQFSEAIASYEKLVKMYPSSPFCAEALYRAGLVNASGLENFEKAVDTFQRVMDEYADSPFAAQSQFMSGFVYANSVSDTARARLAYNTFLEKYPDHELVPSVEWELKYLGKDINEIPALKGLETQQEVTATE